jgi:fatty acid desaturase
MALSFAPNHLGMPLAQTAGSGRRWQIEHTRNIRSNRLGTYLLGGLDLQIEHHLYPTMSRRGLRAMQPQVECECRDAGIAYRRVGMLTALAEVQASLHAVARAARTQ